jgi:hypothetical protein
MPRRIAVFCGYVRALTNIVGFSLLVISHHRHTSAGVDAGKNNNLACLFGVAMSVLPVLESSALDPETLNVAAQVYDIAREDLRLQNHTDPLTRLLAEKVVEVVQTGQRDPQYLARLAVDALGAAVVKGDV